MCVCVCIQMVNVLWVCVLLLHPPFTQNHQSPQAYALCILIPMHTAENLIWAWYSQLPNKVVTTGQRSCMQQHLQYIQKTSGSQVNHREETEKVDKGVQCTTQAPDTGLNSNSQICTCTPVRTKYISVRGYAHPRSMTICTKQCLKPPPPPQNKNKKTNNNNPTHNNNKPTNHKTRSYARITHSSAKQTHLWPLNKVTAIKPTMNLWTPSKVKPSSVWTTWFKQCSRKPVLKVLSNRERPISLEYIWKLEIARSSGIFIIYSR